MTNGIPTRTTLTQSELRALEQLLDKHGQKTIVTAMADIRKHNVPPPEPHPHHPVWGRSKFAERNDRVVEAVIGGLSCAKAGALVGVKPYRAATLVRNWAHCTRAGTTSLVELRQRFEPADVKRRAG